MRTVYESLIQVLDFQISTVYFYLEENSITSSINIILCLGSALLTNDGGINKVGSGQVNLEIFAKLKIRIVMHAQSCDLFEVAIFFQGCAKIPT